MDILIHRLNENAKTPVRAHYNDAGADVFCIGEVEIKPGETIALELGISVEIPDGMMGLIMPKSGLSQKGIVSELSPIDSGYKGEIHAILHNQTNDKIFTFNQGDKVGQLVVLPIVISNFVESFGEERGIGAFGSTGK